VLKNNLDDIITKFFNAKTQNEMNTAMMGMDKIFTPTFMRCTELL